MVNCFMCFGIGLSAFYLKKNKEKNSKKSTIMLQSYILEGALTNVQERTCLEMLSGGSLGLLPRAASHTRLSARDHYTNDLTHKVF